MDELGLRFDGAFKGDKMRWLVAALEAEKAPYVITLFVAALGWTALRTSDRLQQTAFLEYTTELRTPAGAGNRSLATVRLRNVTTKQWFDCFVLEQLTPGKFGKAEDQRIEYSGTVAANATLAKNSPNNWQWVITDFSPGADIVLGAPLTGTSKWNVLVRPCEAQSKPQQAASSRDAQDQEKDKPQAKAPILLDSSLVTWYVEHELRVLWGGLLAWLLALLGLNSFRLASVQAAAAAQATQVGAAVQPPSTAAQVPAANQSAPATQTTLGATTQGAAPGKP